MSAPTALEDDRRASFLLSRRSLHYADIMMKRFVCFLVCLLTLHAFAHDPGLSTAALRLGTNGLEAVLVFSIVDTKELVDVDKNQDGKLSKEELDQGAAELQMMAPQALDVKF